MPQQQATTNLDSTTKNGAAIPYHLTPEVQIPDLQAMLPHHFQYRFGAHTHNICHFQPYQSVIQYYHYHNNPQLLNQFFD